MTEPRDPFVPIGFAAHVVGRSPRTVRTWAREGTVRRRNTAGRVEVHVGDTARAAETRARRKRVSGA